MTPVNATELIVMLTTHCHVTPKTKIVSLRLVDSGVVVDPYGVFANCHQQRSTGGGTLTGRTPPPDEYEKLGAKLRVKTAAHIRRTSLIESPTIEQLLSVHDRIQRSISGLLYLFFTSKQFSFRQTLGFASKFTICYTAYTDCI